MNSSTESRAAAPRTEISTRTRSSSGRSQVTSIVPRMQQEQMSDAADSPTGAARAATGRTADGSARVATDTGAGRTGEAVIAEPDPPPGSAMDANVFARSAKTPPAT